MTTSLPGGEARRLRPSGLRAGRGPGRIEGPAAALGLVAEELAAAERALRTLVVSDVAAVPHVAGYLADAGGKRLRPALTALGARAAGFRGPVAELACCGELIHLGSLLHDDVVDQGEVRRGRPAAQVVWGNAVAVLTGDFCVARALLAASRHGGPRAAEQLAETVTEMAVGEVVQLQHAGDLDNDLATYLSVVERKTASLIGWCAAAGAWAAEDVAAADALQTYGRKVGVAFQITDDVLDYRHGTGKEVGRDLAERKVTLPLLHAMQRLPDLHGTLAEGAPSPAELRELVEVIRASGALDDALVDAAAYATDAVDALRALPPSEARDALEVLAGHVVERSR
ncbi:MAG: polyprenyl synthetase family protein [Alphaproteobacteria bacterium]|nr:polyprenyl synthetase family protein [Alphaproteobacteria bacterium]